MIDYELGKNILNNLLDVQLPEKAGDEAQKNKVLNDKFVTGEAKLDFITYTITGVDGSYEKEALDSSYGSACEYTVDNIQQAIKKKKELEDLYKLETLKCEIKTHSLLVPIQEVEPNISESSQEKPKKCAIGMLNVQLNTFLDSIKDIDFCYLDLVRDTDLENKPYQKDVVINPLKNLNQNIWSIADNLKEKVLVNYSAYLNSIKTLNYKYDDLDGNGIEDIILDEVTTKIMVKKYSKKTQTHYFKIKYNDDDGSNEVMNLNLNRTYYEPVEEEISVTLKSWYYSQLFSTTAFYPQTAYIGLFTDYNHSLDTQKNANGMPDSDGTKFREPPYKKEIAPEGQGKFTYQRMNLHRGLFSDSYVFNEVVEANSENTASKENQEELLGKSYLNNREIIMFPEILHKGEGETKGWGKIYGFGIFSNEVPTEDEKPYFWGPVLGAPIETEEGQVPLFRPSQFEIFLG